METEDEALEPQIITRCAKAAMMLSSLKSIPSRRLKPDKDDDEDEREMLKTVVKDLKLELVRQRMRNRRIRLCGWVERALLVVVLISLWTTSSKLALILLL